MSQIHERFMEDRDQTILINDFLLHRRRPTKRKDDRPTDVTIKEDQKRVLDSFDTAKYELHGKIFHEHLLEK